MYVYVGGGGGIYSVEDHCIQHKRLSLQRGVEDINKGNEKHHFGNLLAEVRNDISRWIFERGGFFWSTFFLSYFKTLSFGPAPGIEAARGVPLFNPPPSLPRS